MTEALDRHGLARVVVTGIGTISSLGHGRDALLQALRERRTGVRAMDAFAALRMRCQVGAPVDLGTLPEPPRKLRRFLTAPGLYAWHAANEALAQAGIDNAMLAAGDCGLVLGGGTAFSEHEAALNSHRERGIERLSPFIVPRGMSSSLSASLAHALDVGGISYTLSSACTSAALAIGQAMELIQLGRQRIVITGGSDELQPSTAMWFDAMGALTTRSNDTPERASRPYQHDRDGFVLGAGAGVLVLESLTSAHERGATVLAELVGYGTATDARSMVGPGADGIARAMRQALQRGGMRPDYINSHACSTPQGDLSEWRAIAAVFAERGETVPPMSSIKGQTGHAPGAAGALDAIAGLLMMEHDFVAAGSTIEPRDPAFAEAPLLTANEPRRIDSVLSNSFGFGGSCASLLFRRAAESAT